MDLKDKVRTATLFFSYNLTNAMKSAKAKMCYSVSALPYTVIALRHELTD